MIQVDLTNNRLTDKQILTFVKEHNSQRFRDNLKYYEGKNPKILDRVFKDTQAPQNRIPMSYGRKIIKTVGGYMYQPGLVAYSFEDEGYEQRIRDVFYENKEPNKTYELGVQCSLQGVGFELHYIDGTIPRFARVSAEESIPLYSWAIEPELIAYIRYVKRDEDTTYVDVYYSDVVARYKLEKQNEYGKEWHLVSLGEEPHYYDSVPLVVFKNNDEMVGDIEPVIPIIDAYDVLMSDAMNEFDRFVWAYLVLKGMKMTKDEAERIKQMRVIQNLDENGAAEFLTKDIPSEFIEFMATKFRKEIHKQSHIPDFTDDQVVSGDLSGKAIRYMLYDFEFIGATKEANFKTALYERFRLINSVLSKVDGDIPDERDIQIDMSRNERADLMEQGQTMAVYEPFVSKRTLLQTFAPFVEDVDEELEAKAEESEAAMELFSAGLSANAANDNEEIVTE